MAFFSVCNVGPSVSSGKQDWMWKIQIELMNFKGQNVSENVSQCANNNHNSSTVYFQNVWRPTKISVGRLSGHKFTKVYPLHPAEAYHVHGILMKDIEVIKHWVDARSGLEWAYYRNERSVSDVHSTPLCCKTQWTFEIISMPQESCSTSKLQRRPGIDVE